MEPRKKSTLDYVLPIIALVFAIFLSLHLAVSYDNVKMAMAQSGAVETEANGREQFDFVMLFEDFSDRISNTPNDIQITDSTPKFVGITIFICLLVGGYLATSQKKFINGKEYGTATWGNPNQISYLFSVNCCKEAIKNIKKSKGMGAVKKKQAIDEAKQKYKSADILLTQTERLSLYHTDSLNCNSIIVAGSGAGKTTGYAIPNILQASDNDYSPCYVVTDPKGEILQRTGYFLKEIARYQLKVLNLKDQRSSFRYNPFRYINVRNDVGDLENQVKKLVTAIMEYQADADSRKGEAFWTEMAVSCAESLFLATHYGFPTEERNMNTVMELFRMLQVDDDEVEFNCDLDLFFRAYEERFQDNSAALSASRKYWEFRKKCRGKTANSVLATMHSKLGAFDNANIRRIFSGDDMELEKLGEERIAVFVVLPPMEKAFNFVANLLYIQMFDMIEYTATVKHEQKLPIPVRFILDEFYNTGKIPSFQNILSYARSFGVSISVIIQSLDQLKEMYEKSWGVVVDNCSTFLYLGGINHPDSLKYISEKLGKGTFDKKNYSRTKGRQSSSTTSEDKLGRELLTPDEVAKIHNRKCVLFISGKNPFYSAKNYFKRHKNYKYTWDANKAKNQFEYNPPVIEEVERPHREEAASRKEDIPYVPPVVTVKDLKVEFDVKKVVEFLEARVLSFDYDKDEMLTVNDGEQDELALFMELEEDEANIRNLLGVALKEATVEVQTNISAVAATTLSLIKAEALESGSLDFDDISVNDGEPDLTEEELTLDFVLEEAESIAEGMNEDLLEFAGMLEGLDLNSLDGDMGAYTEETA